MNNYSARYWDLEKEFTINKKQCLYGCGDTFTRALFQTIIDDADDNVKGKAVGNLKWLMSQAFTYGLIQGKRAERARRKGKPFEIDRELSDYEVLAQMIKILREMSIEEVQSIHASAVEKLGASPDEAEILKRLVDKIIEEKKQEGVS